MEIYSSSIIPSSINSAIIYHSVTAAKAGNGLVKSSAHSLSHNSELLTLLYNRSNAIHTSFQLHPFNYVNQKITEQGGSEMPIP